MRFVETVDKINGLPVGFKEVEYLESTGTQWIDTSVTVDTSTDEIKLYFELTETENYKWIFGEYDTDARIGLGSGDGENKRNFLYQQSATKVSDTQMYNKQHLFEINSNGGFLDGTKIRDYISFASTSTIYLFNLNIDSPSDYRCKSKIWKYEHKRNGVLIRELIPCLDNNGIPCMYDLVGKKAYYNQGTGTDFSYGREIIPVEYLESTGTQYIDTGYRPIPATTKLEFYFSPTTVSGNYFLFGARPDTAATSQYTCTAYFSSGAVRQDWAGINASFPTTSIGNKYLYTAYNNTVSLNTDTVTGTITRSTTRLDYNFLLFTVNTNGTADSRMYIGKVYYTKLWENDLPVRDYIPAIDENNVPFMFDRVTHAVYLNAGTGEFLYGNPVASNKGKIRFPVTQHEKSRLPLGFREVEYLESTGEQYIDLGVGVKANTVFKAIFSIASSSAGYSYFGARNSSNERFQIVNSIGIGAGYYLASSVYPIANQKYEIEMHASGEMYLDGVKRNASNGTFSQVSFERNLWLFATNYYDSSVGSGASTFWKAQVFEGDVIVRDFIPCLDSNGTPCMYDLVEKKAYYNQGTGDFLHGREIHYVEYLESTGEQYIDTGVTSNLDTVVEMNLKVVSYSINNTATFFGGIASNIGISTNISKTNTDRYSRFGTKYTVIKNLDIEGTKSTIKIDKNAFVINGQSWAVEETSSFNGPNMHLFKAAGITSEYNTTTDIYNCKIWDNNTLVRDYIPAIDENNVPFMFDRVTHTIYDNAGTGEFLYENLLKQNKIRMVLPHPVPLIYKPVEYLESTGEQYIDTGVEKGSVSVIRTIADLSFNDLSTINAAGWGQSLSGGCFGFKQNATYIYFNLTGTDENSTLGYTAGKRLKFDLDGVNGKFTIYDGESVAYTATRTPSTSTSNDIGILFGFKNTSGINTKAQTIYSYKMYKNNVLVRDFVPVIRRADEKPGLYCKATKQFFTNAGTGEFLWG